MVREDVDVLVVGGGPAGLATAEAVAPHGRTLLVHQDKSIGKPVRTSGGSWQRDVDILGIPRELYHPIQRLTFSSASKNANVAFGSDRPVVLDVTGTYRYLAKNAKASGAEIRCGTRYSTILDRNGERVVCLISNGTDDLEVHARYVVDASGYRRRVLVDLGVSQEPARFGVGVEYEFEDLSDDRERAILFVGQKYAPAGYGWIFPTRAGTIRIGIGLIRPDTKTSPGRMLDDFLASHNPTAMGIRVGRLLERHSGVIPSDGPAADFLHGRVLAVGDSVSQALPLVGEGIRYCVEAGKHAGAALAAALQDERNYSLHLNRYARWWNAKYRTAFSIAQKANEKVGSFDDRHWDELTTLASSLDGDEMAMMLRAEFDTRNIPSLLLRHGAAGSAFALRNPGRLVRYGLKALGFAWHKRRTFTNR